MIRSNYMLIFSCLVFTASSCGRNTSSSLKEAWDEQNAPNRLISKPNYQTNFSKLPLSGIVKEMPWSDSYWPTYQGGLSFRWTSEIFDYALPTDSEISTLDTSTLSPSEKYDLFTGDYSFRLTTKERARTQVFKTVKTSAEYDPKFEIPGWEGLCHGWAAAAINFKEPKPITLVGANQVAVSFGSSDIKALLSYFQQHKDNQITKSYYLGDRCNDSFEELNKKVKDGKMTAEEAEKIKNSSECRDTNAGAFHLVLANEIGIEKTAFIVDLTRDAEVWNQPVHKYTSKVLSESTTVSQDAAPGTVKEVLVETIMHYVVEIHPREEAIGHVEKKETYRYKLELNANGEIIGGSWVSENRPDFLWRESPPQFRGYFKALGYIYQKSIEN